MEASNFENWRNGDIVSLKVLFYIHIVLISCSLGSWVTASFLFYNSVFIFLFGAGLLLRDKTEPLEMAVVVNVISGIFDLITIPFSFPARGVVGKLSATVALLHMLLRLYSHFVLRREITNRREGTTNTFYGGPYQNIDDSGPTV